MLLIHPQIITPYPIRGKIVFYKNRSLVPKRLWTTVLRSTQLYLYTGFLAGAVEPAVIGVGLQEAALLLMTHPTVFMWDGHPSVSQPNP